jgi:uncharacterized protein (TIGR02246 family)
VTVAAPADALTWADKVEIHELISRYNLAADAGDGEAYAATFTEDGSIQFLDEVVSGRQALAELGRSLPLREHDGRHLSANVVIEVDGDGAVARSTFVKVIAGAPARFGGTASFRDELRRTEGGWRFARRRAVADLPG